MLGENQRRDLLRTALNVGSAEQPAVGVAALPAGLEAALAFRLRRPPLSWPKMVPRNAFFR
jgi:hypothetical protein